MASVSGTVTLDDQPLATGTVVFVADGQPMAVGQIESNGRYRVRTGQTAGMEPGSYRVKISAYKTRTSPDGLEEPAYDLLTPARYHLVETSGLTAEIAPGRNPHVDFRLSGGTEEMGNASGR